MSDDPKALLILAEVRRALDDGVQQGFHQKVAANALGIAQRELEQGPESAAAEAARLRALLQQQGDRDALNAHLAQAIRDGRPPTDAAALVGHLVRTSIEKLRIDQPGYAAFRNWQAGVAAKTAGKG